MAQLHNKPELKQKRKNLRNNSTQVEIILWRYLKQSQLNGLKFRRQHSIGPYIVDFYCPEKRVAIELDGDIHNKPDRIVYDRRRQRYLEQLGIMVLRFPNEQVIDNVEAIILNIRTTSIRIN